MYVKFIIYKFYRVSSNVRILSYAKSIICKFYYVSFNMRILSYARFIVCEFYCMSSNAQILLGINSIIQTYKFYHAKCHHVNSNVQISLYINSIVRVSLCKIQYANSIIQFHHTNFIVHLSTSALFVRLESNLKYSIILLAVH